MYFWNIEALKQEIVEGTFTDGEVIQYIIVFVGLSVAAIEVMMYFPYDGIINYWTYTLSVLSLLINIGGTIYAYKLNGGPNGKDFASKFFGIGFVVAVRLFVYFIPVMVIMGLYWIDEFGTDKAISTTFFEVVVFAVWNILFYLRMAKHIENTAKA